MRTTVVAVVSSLLLVACGSSTLSMSEYADEFNELRAIYEPQAEGAWVEYSRIADPALADVATLASREAAIRADIGEDLRALEPPAEIADLHDLLVDWVEDLRVTSLALADRASVAASWDDLLDSPEFLAFEATLTGGADACNEFQAKLDATAARGAFADTPWIPAEMKDIADAVLGCDIIPEDLDVILRP
jgi:hypothetical protein